LRKSVADKYSEKLDTILVNPGSQSQEIVDAIKGNVSLVPSGDVKSTIKEIARARVLVAFDDGNMVMNGVWLSSDATLVVIVPPKSKFATHEVGLLSKAGRKIVWVEGETQGAVSDATEILQDCLSGKRELDTPECKSAYRNIKYRVDPKKVAQAVAAIQ
jgi:hypothetical protein